MQTQIPVTILTGFLGAGKTTLLNQQLKQKPQEEQWLIIENEFGAVNIDSELIQDRANLNLIELTNGCICCSVQGDFIKALHELIEKQESGALHFDRIIIETTGIADPAPLIQLFFIDERVRTDFHLDAVVTVVDFVHFLSQIKEHKVVHSQIAFADRLILTKSDSITSELRDQIEAFIRKINLKAPLIETKNTIPAAFWLDTNSFDLNDELTLANAAPCFRSIYKEATEPEITSFVLEAGELDLKKIGQWTEQLISDFGNDMMRYKGIFAIKGEPRKLIVQGVHKIVGFDYGNPWEEEPRISKFVIIGRDLPTESIKSTFLEAAI